MNRHRNARLVLFQSFLFSGLLLFTSFGETKKEDKVASNSIEYRLNAVKGKGILFGHQDDLAYGIGWRYVDGESDVKRVAGDYPALFGWELGGLELGNAVNLDSVPFETMRKLAIKAHNMGGINTFSWHPFSVIDKASAWTKEADVVRHIVPGGSHHEAFKKHLDKVADFFKSLKTDDGQQVPFIFRPWHEMDGDWFWWGSKQCTTTDFQELFKFTIHYLRETKGLDNMLSAYSPDNKFNTLEEYYSWYPGDEYVDIMGMDNYGDLKKENGERDAIRKLHIVIEAAKSKNKFAALTETGHENVTDSMWFTEKLGVVLQDPIVAKELSYAMVWRSDDKVHFFFPYPCHAAAEDAKTFLDRPEILLLNDFIELQSK